MLSPEIFGFQQSGTLVIRQSGLSDKECCAFPIPGKLTYLVTSEFPQVNNEMKGTEKKSFSQGERKLHAECTV